MNVEVCCSRYW